MDNRQEMMGGKLMPRTREHLLQGIEQPWTPTEELSPEAQRHFDFLYLSRADVDWSAAEIHWLTRVCVMMAEMDELTEIIRREGYTEKWRIHPAVMARNSLHSRVSVELTKLNCFYVAQSDKANKVKAAKRAKVMMADFEDVKAEEDALG